MINHLFPLSAFPNRLSNNSHLWLRPLIVLGVLGISAALAYQSSLRFYQLIFVLPFAVGGGVFLLRQPALGFLFLIGSMMIPFNGPSGSNLTLAIAVGLIGLWTLDMVIIQKRVQLMSSITIIPLFALMIVASLAFGVGRFPWYAFAQWAPLPAQIAGLSLFFISPGLYLVVAHRLHEVRWLKWMVWLFLAIGSLSITGWVVQGQIGDLIGYFFTTQTTGSLFWTWLFILAFSQAAFNDDLHPLWRGGLAALAIATFYVMVRHLWAWNSGWVPPIVSVCAIVAVAWPRFGLAALMAAVLGGLTQLPKIIDAVMVGDNEYSLATRLEAWIILWDIVKINPILGLGPANYYWYTPLFPIRGYAVQFNSHQQYADLVLQTGILGLICFIWFFATIGWVVWGMRHRFASGFNRAYVYAAIGGVVGTFASAAFGDWVIPFFYNVNLGGFRSSMLSWLFLGGLIALERMTRKPEPEIITGIRQAEAPTSTIHNH